MSPRSKLGLVLLVAPVLFAVASTTRARLPLPVLLLALLFYGGLGVLLWCCRGELRRLRELATRQDWREGLLATLMLVVLGGRVTPNSLGLDYAAAALHPFAQEPSWVHRRLLAPALAHLLHLDGPLYVVFALALNLLAVVLTLATLRASSAGAPLGAAAGAIERISITTGSFLMFQFFYPGYPDPLVLVLILAFLRLELPAHAEAALLVLMLLTHEALALFMMAGLLLRARQPLVLMGLFGLYGLILAASHGFDLADATSRHLVVLGHSTTGMVFSQLPRAALGLLASHKLYWLAIGWGLVVALRGGEHRSALLIALCTLVPCLQLTIATDASRLAGMGVIGLLLAFPLYARSAPPGLRLAVAVVNLIVPSCYVDLPNGALASDGLYGLYALHLWR